MAELEDWLIDIHEKFEKARKLIEEGKDCPSEPFKSKYSARDILKEIKCDLVKREIDDDVDTVLPSRVKVMTAATDYLLGTLYVETEEWSSGEHHLNSCWEKLEPYEMDPTCCLVIIGNYNQLGILWANRIEPEKAKMFLSKAEYLYKKYQHDVGKPVLTVRKLFGSTNETEDEISVSNKQLERAHTLTLYYLAQVYSALEESNKSAMYCHETLQRQLIQGGLDEIDWALNAATLSQYFLSKDQFVTARHHLACASFILSQYEERLKNEDRHSYESIMEQLDNRKADIARCWAKYGLLLINSSHKRLVDETEEGEEDSNLRRETTEESISSNEEKQELTFPSLEVTHIEEQVRCKPVNVFSEARGVFLNSQKWLNDAKLFYTLDDHASDYVELVQENSKLYKALILFEPDYDRQCKMHKRRIDMLEAVLKELNPQYYLMICRQLMFEIADTYSEMMDLKKLILEESGSTDNPSSTTSLQKIQLLIKKGIENYEAFIDTVRDKHTDEIPEKMADELVRPTLIAHFCCGRLYSKLTIASKQAYVASLNKSLEKYRYIVDYLKRVPEHVEHAKAELEVCTEMVNLLPAKINRIASSE